MSTVHSPALATVPAPVRALMPKAVAGNVELWSPAFLPKGTAHVPGSLAAKVAQQLGVHYADAVVGFDRHAGGGAHPVRDGIVVLAHSEGTMARVAGKV